MRRVALTVLGTAALMQIATVALWMNPLTTRVILTREFGQSDKLINVWTVWAPLPRLMDEPPLAMMAGFLLFTALHVGAYRMVAPVLPGHSWIGRGLALAAGIWMFQYAYFEFFGPFNQYREPVSLIAYELLLQAAMAVVEGLAIARWAPAAWARRPLS